MDPPSPIPFLLPSLLRRFRSPSFSISSPLWKWYHVFDLIAVLCRRCDVGLRHVERDSSYSPILEINITVWWDYTSCPVPHGASPHHIADTIIRALRLNQIDGTISIKAFGLWQHHSASSVDSLQDSGITLVHVNEHNDQGTMSSLSRELNSWVAQHQPPVHLLFVSNDTRMKSTLRQLRIDGYNVLLSSTDIRSTASLCRAATLWWQWNLLAKGVDLTPQQINLPPIGVNWSYGGNIKQLVNQLIDQELMEERVGQSTLDEIRRALELHPNGISIRMLRKELKSKQVKKKSYRKFVNFLKSMPRFVEFLCPPNNEEPYVALLKKVEGSAASTTAEANSNEQDVKDWSGSDSESCFGDPSLNEDEQDQDDSSESNLESSFCNPSAIGESNKESNKIVFFGFEASDNNCKDIESELKLLRLQLGRASVEMVGEGTPGMVYHLLLEDGRMLALKVIELDDSNPYPMEPFYRYINLMGQLRHPNIVSLRVFSKVDLEIFLIYDFLPNGTLHSCIHGKRGPGREPLDWTARLRLLLGVARGLSWIHEYGIPHGSIKSGNILIGENNEACISDFWVPFLSPAHEIIAQQGGYMAPEQAASNMLSQEADAYNFGVLALEVLTGRVPTQCLPVLPDSTSQKKHTKSVGVASVNESDIGLVEWVRLVMREEGTGGMLFDYELLRDKDIEAQMVSLLQVGLACVNQLPDKRPKMSVVVKWIEAIWVE